MQDWTTPSPVPILGGMKPFFLAVSLALCGSATPGRAVDSPDWWRRTRAIYAPAACTGAGSNLMKFHGCPGSLDEVIDSFEELPRLLDDARRLGSDVVYLVDYWEGGYSAKGTYEPARKLGGETALRKGIRTVHRRGGRVILYVEPFIVSRKTNFGRRMGPLWGMQDASGRFYDYPGTRNAFYLMQPRSGWADHLAACCRRLVGDLGADGVFLDSYGCQTGWRDYHPDHPGADAPGWFDEGAVELTRRIRDAVRQENPEAIVMTECDVQEALNRVTDGALEESLATLDQLDWYRRGERYHVFVSEFSLAAMEEILACGLSVSLNPWWFRGPPDDDDFERWLSVEMDLGTNRRRAQKAMRGFMTAYNFLYANGVRLQDRIDVEGLLRQTLPFTCDRLEMSTEERTETFRKAVRLAREAMRNLDPGTRLSVADFLRRIVRDAQEAGTAP